ncbi:hypothetical protein DRQ25_17635 [Candidatus Fermentibacteria bacterium]|nr:MAG: hypothetical protein DRQ25_17635 [Candidatus Fermentibacteria bacterium]
MKTLIILLMLCTAAQASSIQLYEHRPYSQEEVSLLNWFELTILRNELFAMQGYVFSTDWLAAYYDSQDWYSPSPSFTTAAEFPTEFTNEQQANIDLFLASAEGLEESIEGCCYSEVRDLEVEYYSQVYSWTDRPPVPDWYDSYTSVQPQLGGYPDYSAEDLLPFDFFNDLYTGSGVNENTQAWITTLDRLHQYGVQSKSVYRVYFRPERTIAKVERVTLDIGDSAGNHDPYVLWTAYYATNSIFIIFVPDCKLEWASRDVALIYTCSGDECTLRAAFRGIYPTLTMEIYEGPYSDLPLSIEINNEDIGGDERYEELFAGRY